MNGTPGSKSESTRGPSRMRKIAAAAIMAPLVLGACSSNGEAKPDVPKGPADDAKYWAGEAGDGSTDFEELRLAAKYAEQADKKGDKGSGEAHAAVAEGAQEAGEYWDKGGADGVRTSRESDRAQKYGEMTEEHAIMAGAEWKIGEAKPDGTYTVSFIGADDKKYSIDVDKGAAEDLAGDRQG